MIFDSLFTPIPPFHDIPKPSGAPYMAICTATQNYAMDQPRSLRIHEPNGLRFSLCKLFLWQLSGNTLIGELVRRARVKTELRCDNGINFIDVHQRWNFEVDPFKPNGISNSYQFDEFISN